MCPTFELTVEWVACSAVMGDLGIKQMQQVRWETSLSVKNIDMAETRGAGKVVTNPIELRETFPRLGALFQIFPDSRGTDVCSKLRGGVAKMPLTRQPVDIFGGHQSRNCQDGNTWYFPPLQPGRKGAKREL